MAVLENYSHQAGVYDSTRGVSGSVLPKLLEVLAGAPGARLADIGGGTGNYALALREHGFEPLVIDRSPEMLARAADKGLATLVGDAEQLPVSDASFDAVIMISMLHNVARPAAAIAEARRILRPGGEFVALLSVREDLDGLWLLRLFPSSHEWMLASHPSLNELEALMPGVERIEVRIEDLNDASMTALAAHPELVLQKRWRSATSYFDRMEREHPDEFETGLAHLREMLAENRPPHWPGSCSLLRWHLP
jgi:ubiquinone/menaquinone biosynthesis C-methylase UbiE